MLLTVDLKVLQDQAYQNANESRTWQPSQANCWYSRENQGFTKIELVVLKEWASIIVFLIPPQKPINIKRRNRPIKLQQVNFWF